ncbi:MAG: hypothetical protein ACK42L_10985, partial [Thermoanaerobaculum sp.]
MINRIAVALLIFSMGSHFAIGGEFLADRRFPPETLFAASAEGALLTVHGDALELWSEAGKLLRSCELTDPRLQGTRSALALNGDVALFAFLEPEAGSEESRKLVAVNVQDCRVVASFSLPGVVLGLRGGASGWLAVTKEVGNNDYSYAMVDSEGHVLASFSVPEELQESVLARGFPSGPSSLVASGDRVLMVAKTRYELWFPAQKGRLARKLPMLECLAVEGQWLSGEESEKELRRRIAHAGEETRRIIEDFLKKGGSHRGFMAAVRNVTAYRNWLAVLLRDLSVPGGCRLDVWDLAQEAPIAVSVLPEVPCPDRFFALVRDGVWAFSQD